MTVKDCRVALLPRLRQEASARPSIKPGHGVAQRAETGRNDGSGGIRNDSPLLHILPAKVIL
jgi:hypothetical protein